MSLRALAKALTNQRDALAAEIRSALDEAAFANKPLNGGLATSWLARANNLISQASALGSG
jgi:hypothetical protein